jgi:hypothetical protein
LSVEVQWQLNDSELTSPGIVYPCPKTVRKTGTPTSGTWQFSSAVSVSSTELAVSAVPLFGALSTSDNDLLEALARRCDKAL